MDSSDPLAQAQNYLDQARYPDSSRRVSNSRDDNIRPERGAANVSDSRNNGSTYYPVKGSSGKTA